MQKTIKIIFTLLFCLLFLPNQYAQTIGKNNRGETVVKFPDGSWRYYNENDRGDQKLMRDYLKSLETQKKNASTQTTNVEEDTSDDGLNWDFDPTPTAEMSEQAAREEAIRRVHTVRKEQSKAIRTESRALQEYEKISAYLADLKNRKNVSKAKLQKAKLQKKQAKSNLKIAAAARKAAIKETELYRKMIPMTKAKRDKTLAKLASKPVEPAPTMVDIGTVASTDPKPMPSTPSPKPTKAKKTKTPKTKTPKVPRESVETATASTSMSPEIIEPTAPAYDYEKDMRGAKKSKTLPAKDNVILNPPRPNCEIAFDGVDEFSGKNRRDVAARLFFTYTDEQLRQHYRGKERIVCEGNVTNVTGGYKFLTLKIIVNDAKAQRTYGLIEKSSMLTVKLIDGTNVALLNNKTDSGVLNKAEGTVTYYGQYMITPNQQKHLEKTEIDLVRLVWSTGYEDYDIYETDFLINQFECLNSDIK